MGLQGLMRLGAGAGAAVALGAVLGAALLTDQESAVLAVILAGLVLLPGLVRPTLAWLGQVAVIAVTAAALVVMPLLALAKRRTGQALGSHTLVADSAETAFCAFTSAAALIGLGLNAWLGWWWADPAAALVIAALAVKEGIEAWEHDD